MKTDVSAIEEIVSNVRTLPSEQVSSWDEVHDGFELDRRLFKRSSAWTPEQLEMVTICLQNMARSSRSASEFLERVHSADRRLYLAMLLSCARRCLHVVRDCRRELEWSIALVRFAIISGRRGFHGDNEAYADADTWRRASMKCSEIAQSTMETVGQKKEMMPVFASDILEMASAKRRPAYGRNKERVRKAAQAACVAEAISRIALLADGLANLNNCHPIWGGASPSVSDLLVGSLDDDLANETLQIACAEAMPSAIENVREGYEYENKWEGHRPVG